MPFIDIDTAAVGPERVRTEFDAQKHHELANDILKHGLFHAPVFFKDLRLLAGERRVRAIKAIYDLRKTIKYNGEEVPFGQLPVTFIEEMDEIQKLEAEVAENTCRLDLTWQDRARATERLFRLKQLLHPQEQIAVPHADRSVNMDLAMAETIAERKQVPVSEVKYSDSRAVNEDLILATWLQGGDADVAEAKDRKSALKIIEEKLERGHREALAREFKIKTPECPHTLLHGDCIEILNNIPSHTFDVIITDPPYGMGLSEMPDLQGGVQHHYDDTREGADKVIQAIFDHSWRITKPLAHLYMFCDISRFFELKALAERHQWDVWSRPLIWHRSDSSGMLPDAERGPRRVYECILFARKGDKRVLQVAGDVLSYGGDREERSAARKPVPLLVDLLKRSCLPGDAIFDPCCGSGPVFSAAQQLQLTCVGIEKNEAVFGLATKRISEILSQTSLHLDFS